MKGKSIYQIKSESELPALAQQLLEFTESNSKNNIFILNGDLGAGKTTFVKEIAKQLQCTEAVTSPTYAIVNEYITTENIHIYHFDLYRMNSLEEIEAIGFWDYLDGESYIFIEWADLVLPQLENYIRINIQTLANDIRTFTFEHIN